MAATPIKTQSTTFSIDDSGSTPVAIAGIDSFSRADGESTQIDVTTLASTAKEFCQGLKDNGTLTLNFIWDNDDLGQAELRDAQDNQSQRTFIITLSDSTTVTFESLVLSISMEGAADDVVRGSANLKVTGAITIS